MADAAPIAPDLGRVLGQYRLLQLLGEGGMGTVYLAEHTRLGKRVALKLLKQEHASNPAVVRRFFDEARVVNAINHEHIVEVIDFVEAEEKYIVMELLQGQTLREVMSAGVVPYERLLHVAEQTARALAAVHDAKVVHRDLKPDNIFLAERGGRRDFVKVLDFGVAKLAGAADEAVSVNRTAAGAVLGTPEYMAPEQLGGKPVDARADIYSFGVILFELVCGVKPFEAETFGEIVIKHLTVPPPDPRALAKVPAPKELIDLILQCLDKDPARRPASMKWVCSCLLALQGKGEPVAAEKPTRARWPIAAGAGGALVIAAIAFALWPKRVVVAPPPPVVVSAPEPPASVPASAPAVAPAPPPVLVEAREEKTVEKPAAKGKKKGKKKRDVDKGGLFDPFK